MRKTVYKTLVICLIGFFISSCSWLQGTPETNKETRCNEMNRQMIFNGSTNNAIKATQQRAQSATLANSYRAEGC